MYDNPNSQLGLEHKYNDSAFFKSIEASQESSSFNHGKNQINPSNIENNNSVAIGNLKFAE